MRKRGDPPTTSDDGTPLEEEGADQVHSLAGNPLEDQIAYRRCGYGSSSCWSASGAQGTPPS
jgi:hypothetical protein